MQSGEVPITTGDDEDGHVVVLGFLHVTFGGLVAPRIVLADKEDGYLSHTLPTTPRKYSVNGPNALVCSLGAVIRRLLQFPHVLDDIKWRRPEAAGTDITVSTNHEPDLKWR